MIQSFSPPKVVRQQGVTALLLYQDQTVSFRMQRLRIPKKTVNHPFSILRLTYCAGRWQSTSWLCYCLIKIGTEVLETITQSALRRMWVVKVRNSLYLEADKELAALFQVQLLVFRFSYEEILPIHSLSKGTLRFQGAFFENKGENNANI